MRIAVFLLYSALIMVKSLAEFYTPNYDNVSATYGLPVQWKPVGTLIVYKESVTYNWKSN